MVDFALMLERIRQPCSDCGATPTVFWRDGFAWCREHEPRVMCGCGLPEHDMTQREADITICPHCTVFGCNGKCTKPHNMVTVWTANFQYRDHDRLDITRKSAGAEGIIFAPSWKILGPELERRKAGLMSNESWAEYVKLYTEELKASAKAHKQSWYAILWRKSVTLVCYCKEPQQCHRTVLAMILAKNGARYIGERYTGP